MLQPGNNAVLFSFPLFSVHNGACMAAAVTLRVGHRNAVFFCITMLQPVNNAVLFSFPFLSLFFLWHNGACMATQCWHSMLLHSNNAVVCATHCYAWQHNDHLRSHSHLHKRCSRACVWHEDSGGVELFSSGEHLGIKLHMAVLHTSQKGRNCLATMG